MRTTTTSAQDPRNLISIAWLINVWLIDANTQILSPLLTTHDTNLEPNDATTQWKSETTIEATNEYLSAATAMVIMYPYQAEALMRFIASVSYNELSSKAGTRIDTATSLNFVSKEFVTANGFFKDCKSAPMQSIRVASEQRISKVFTIDVQEFADIQS